MKRDNANRLADPENIYIYSFQGMATLSDCLSPYETYLVNLALLDRQYSRTAR